MTGVGIGEVRLGAALFNADQGHLAEELERLQRSGIDFIHLDVFDGRLTPDLAFAPATIASLRLVTALPFEVHLAAQEPERVLPALASAGAELVCFHVEGAPMVYETVFAVRELGLRVGIAAGLATPLEHLEAALPFVDAVLLLSRVTGEGTRGATFDSRVLERVRRIRGSIDALGADVELQVAGGVNRTNLGDLRTAGARACALGAGLFRADDLADEVRVLRMLARGEMP